MRYYLDTNILIFMKLGMLWDLSDDIKERLRDFGNILYTSSVCVHELIHLCQIGKVSKKSGNRSVSVAAVEVLPWLREMGIGIRTVTERHLQAMAELPIRREHRDPFDRLIIAQAIADGVGVITSDRQFEGYRRYGLGLTFNER